MSAREADDNPYPDAVRAIRGYRERITPGSKIKVIEIDFTADPSKDSVAWLDARIREQGDAKTRREYLRDWTVATGDAYYPEYANNGGVFTYGFTAKGIVRSRPVGRGWDFGFRKPAVTWGQRVGNRAFAYRQLMIANVDTYTLADLVKFLSGEIEQGDMIVSAQAAYDQLVATGVIDEGPWFPRGTVFQDYSGPECFKVSAQVKDGDPKSDYEVLASKGIILSAPRVEILDREKIMRKLLHVDKDGRPGFKADVRCVDIHNMLNGGLAYPPPTRENPKPSKPRKDGHFDNIHDALTYWLVQEFPLVDARNPGVRQVVYVDNAPYEVVDNQGYESLGLYETRAQRLKKL